MYAFRLEDFDSFGVKEEQVFKHGSELVDGDTTTLCLDSAMAGVGGINSWGATPLPEHMIHPDDLRGMSFVLTPF